MHKAFKACTAVLLALVMTVSLVNGALAAVVRNDDDTISYEPLEQGVYSKGGYTIDKVSHPTLGAGEVDGILTGDLQDRGQSYSWSMAEAGDYVYIGTCYNSTYYIYHNNVKTSLDAMKKEGKLDQNVDTSRAAADFVKVMFGTDTFDETPMSQWTPVIMAVNRYTGEAQVIFRERDILKDYPDIFPGYPPYLKGVNYLAGYRMAFEFKGKIYFAGMGSPTATLIEVDPETNECSIAYHNINYTQGVSNGVHGLLVFDDEIYMCLASDNYDGKGTPGGIIVASSDPTAGLSSWRRVADQDDFDGLPVCVVPKPGYARKFAFFTTRYGGMDMRFQLDGQWLYTPAGIAHYLEHKMFDTADGSAMQDLARGGAEPNAYTSNAVTAYYFDCTEHFYDNLRILLSFVSVPYFTDESVEKEQGIIAQEIGMIEDNPEWQVYRQMMQALYRHSPVRQSVAGSVESIRQITAQTLYDCHKAFYTPANMCLVVVGDVDPAEVVRAAREILPRESGPVIPRDYGREEDLTPHMTRIEDRMEVAMPTFLLGFKCPPVPEGPDRMRLDILGDLACDVLMGESSPLFTRLYSQGLINGTFDSAYDLLPGAAYVFCGGDSNDPEAVQQAVLDEARRVVREGVDPAYVQRLRRASFGASIKSLNSFEAIASTVSEGCFQGYDPFRFPEVYDSITQQDLLDFIRDNIRPERMALSVIYPKE